MQLPSGAPSQRKADNALIKALARAFRWNRTLKSCEFASISELAEKEGIAFTYMARILRLTLLAPEIVDVIMTGRQPPAITLANLMDSFPLDWSEQHARWLVDDLDTTARQASATLRLHP